ncbi:MAG TPA: PQQ-binding-like beta-propeller repeat protein, partial [Planctomycetaceae bacterium]|nr:PQQ-binding-like beta-propeller repeat protein [Planctomycetaceae bacterium]
IGWHPGGRGLAAWRSVTTGQFAFGDKALTEPWRRAPVWSADGRQFIVVGESGRITAYSATGSEQWRSADPASQSHAAPWVFERDGRWFAVFDGLTLVRLNADGKAAWSATLAAAPLADPARQLGIATDRVIAAVGGECRCLDLDDGHELWSRTLTTAAPFRTFVIGPQSDQALLLPDHAVSDLECVSLQSGQTRQRLRLPRPSQQVAATSDADGVLLATESDALALAPQPPTRLAQER